MIHQDEDDANAAVSTEPAIGPPSPSASAPISALAALLPLFTACGGGPPPPITASEASRFLAQASMGATRAEIASVMALGYAGWIDAQLALPTQGTRWDWLLGKGYGDVANKNSQTGFDAVAWRKLLASPDTLRQRVVLALSEILVVGIDGLVNGGGWTQFSGAAYLDLLEANAFGNLRTLLDAVSRSVPMGLYLTYKGNVKANPSTGTLPDENYARELMQLFTIGLLQLNADGTLKQVGGKPVESYSQDDITGLARVFTGWDLDLAGGNTNTPDYQRRPMAQVASRHESGAKTFLGTAIPASTDGSKSLQLALDAIYAHPNLAPFWSQQLIQRLVTSNPSAAYVGRVSAVFANDGSGARGNLQAVIKAVLLDDEARGLTARGGPSYGKLREPILRIAGWARAFNLASASDAWAMGNTTDPSTRLSQSPLRSPSVFNFFRPGYVPPSSALGSAGLVAPEFQLTNESSVVGYLNFLQRLVNGSVGDMLPDYTSLLTLADTGAALLGELNLVLAAGAVGSVNLATMTGAIDSMAKGTDAARKNRIYAALMLVMAAPEYLVAK
ncbi:MAG: DUF1800 family protein [Burkholderiales bacterium]|nr:DUF1800 family protein [Burkholderiales bacterium]